MTDHSQKWHDGSSSRNIESSSNSEGIAAIVNKLENLGRDMKKLKENIYAIQVGCQTCEGAHLDNDYPHNEEVKGMEEVKYGEFSRPFPNNIYDGFSNNEEQETDDSGMAEAVAALEAILKKKIEEPKKEALVHQTMESLKKIKINRPLLKEIRQTDNYAMQMKYLVENKPRTEEENEIRMNPRCSALLQNHLPPKEQDPGSFILPYSIGKLDFKNDLADLGTNINIMPFSMYKRLGIGKLKPINMLIEMADNTKCAPKGIVENLLIKIDKFIFPVDFVILDMVEDLRMPIILGRPLLATAHAQVDIFRKTISLEVRSEKKNVIGKAINDSKQEELEWENLSLNDWMRIRYEKVCKMTRERILKDYWRERFGDEEDDLEEYLEDLEECENDKANTILGVIHDKLNNDWFNNTSEDEDDLEGILDYLKPRSYDGYIDLDDEAYNKRMCRLLGMTYEELITSNI
ncbi:hypothetical protein Tco_0605994 [Tanacetum coccineum]